MAFDEGLAQRLRENLEERTDVVEKKMFGGIAFMVSGNMCCGVIRDLLLVRVGPDAYEAAMQEAHAREMDFTGKPMKGYVTVAPDGFASDAALADWIERGLDFVLTLPAK